MAIAKIKKIELIGLEKDREGLLGLLQNLGMLQLISLKAGIQTEPRPAVYSEGNLLELQEAISYLAGFSKEHLPLGGLVKLKPVVYPRQFKEVVNSFNYQGVLADLSALRNQLKDIAQQKEKLIQERHALLPWQNLNITLDELHYSGHCAIILGVLSQRHYQSWLEDCTKEKVNLFVERVHRDRANLYLAIIYLQEDVARLERILKDYQFHVTVLARYPGRAEERISEINHQASELDKNYREVESKIFCLCGHKFSLMVIYDYLDNSRRTREAEKNLAKQKFTFSLSSWGKEKDVRALEEKVWKNFPDAAVFMAEPQENEEVPVVLENKRILQPFEFITYIYGMPKYKELDPTPFLAPFFFLYFGFCVSDAGYGFLLALICFFVLKKFRMGPQGKKFFKLFFYCGISTMLVGAFTGSWFGNLFDLLAQSQRIFLPLKKMKDALIILDPLKEPTRLLGIALSFGILQVWFGNVVAGIGNFKNRRYADILLDQVPMLTFLFGLTGLGLIFLNLFNKSYLGLFKNITFFAALALVSTQGRAEKGIGGKLFYGIYNLYNSCSGYLSDILSYSRLWALGLVTGVMAATVNLIAVQFSQIVPAVIPGLEKITLLKLLISGIIMVTVFIFGHAVSFLMSLLGAFVHPLRLQFVEFFSKFFKSGGRSFQPFKVETKYINFH